MAFFALLTTLVAPAFSPPPQAAVADDHFTPHKVARLRSVTSAKLSPDGSRVAYTLSVPREAGEDDDGPSWTELHIVDVESGRNRAFISGEVRVSGLEWTKDGEQIAFLSKRGDDEYTGLYLIPVDGGEARRGVMLDKASISSYDLAPDGKRVVCIASAPKDEDEEKASKKGFKQVIYEEDWKPSEVWIADLNDEEVEARRLEIEGHVSAVEWSPVADQILIAHAPTPLVDDSYMRKRVAVVDAGSGEVLASIENPGKLGKIGWSPDGAWVTMIAGGDIHDPNAGRLLIAPAGGGDLIDLLPGYQGDAEDFGWSDADALLFIGDQGVWSSFQRVQVADGAGNAPETIVQGGGPILSSMDLAADGISGAFVADSPQHPSEVYFMQRGDGAPRRLTDSNPWLAEMRFAQQEVVQFQARDGQDLEGLLIRPLDEVEGQRYPLILYVHGGPESHHSNGWLTSYSAPGQVGAARGFAVFYTNYRGSTGRGVEFSKLSQGDPAGKEFDDLVDAVDHLIDIGLVDGDKVGVTGGSYGGYATGWCSTRYSDRFAAGVMFVGISNKISKVGTTDIPDEEFYVHARKRPWDDWQFMLERSPIYYAGQAKTPLLIMHGQDDPRVDPGQSHELYRHLKLRGEAPVRLVLYPGEGHGNRKAAARLDYNLRSLRWFEHYLKGPGGEAPEHDLDHSDPAQASDEEAEEAAEEAEAESTPAGA